MLRIRVTTAEATILETELITAGRRGLQCAFAFSDDWEGLAKTVIVRGVVKRDIVLVGDTIAVPGECLEREQFPLHIGVYGANGEGEIVIPTIWADFGKIRPSARPSGVSPDEVTPNVVAQIQQNSSTALYLASLLTQRANNGEFNGRDGATGPQGTAGADGVDGADGNGIWWTGRPITDVSMAGQVYGQILTARLSGRSGTPAVHDLVVGPPVGTTDDPSYLYEIIAAGTTCELKGIGSIKGATGATGPQGDPGLGFPAGGKALHVLRKKTDADHDTEWANPMDLMSDEVKQAILEFAEEVAYAYPTGMAIYTRLYNAFYPPKTVVLITAVFEQGSTVIYDDTALDDLKQYLTVTAVYDDNTTAILADSSYTLSGLLEAGTSTVTVAYNGLTTTFTVNVTARPTLSSISAAYTQSGTVYTTDSLDSLKSNLVVTATYSDSSTATVAEADYTLSGTLTAGTSTITVSYGGKTTTFNVVVSDAVLVRWSYTDGLPGDNGLTKTEDGTVTETLEQSDLKLTVGGGNGKFVRYSYDYTPTGAVLEAKIKTGSTSNFFYLLALKDAFSIRCQYSNNYKGIYLCDSTAGIASTTRIGEFELNTVYTIRIVLDSGYADVYVNGTLISSHIDTSTIVIYKTFTGVHFSAAGSSTYTGYLYFINMDLEGGI